jgi:PIN domain nuclease of toxin-antitoxin system
VEAVSVIYVDTHVIAWLYQGELARISSVVQKRLDADADVRISPIVALELELLYEIKRVKAPAAHVIVAIEREAGIRVCPLPLHEVVDSAYDLKWTRDPFDRLIVAHAAAAEAPLITRDEHIRRHYARAIW